jgi:K+-sensing histidine kinase KdpD
MTIAATTTVPALKPRSAVVAYSATLAAVAAATLAAVLVDAVLGAPNASLVFVLPVVFAAATFGWTPAFTAAVAGVVAYNFFLIEPRHTFRIAEPANVWALLLLLVTAAAVSIMAAESRRRALAAVAGAEQATTLQSLARSLVGATSQQAIADGCAEAVSQLFRAPAVVLLEDRQAFGVRAVAGGAQLSPADEEAARWALAALHASHGGAYPTGDADFDFWPVVTRSRQAGVIGVRLADPDVGRPEAPERLVEIVEGYLSVALDREAYAQRALRRQVESAGERLKADLLAAVSHDLKTPLSTILLTLQSLRTFDRDHDAATRAELLAGAAAEAARLSRMVENLLDMSRIEAGAVTARAAPAVRSSTRRSRARGISWWIRPCSRPRSPTYWRTPANTRLRAPRYMFGLARSTAWAGSMCSMRVRGSTAPPRRCSRSSCAAWKATAGRPGRDWAFPSPRASWRLRAGGSRRRTARRALARESGSSPRWRAWLPRERDRRSCNDPRR